MTEAKKPYAVEGRGETIFKVMNRENNPYVVMDRRPLENADLSYKAKGILAYLLSRPDGWEVNVPDLTNRGTDGAASIRTGLKELRACGHIRYNPSREGGYIKKWVIEVYEVPTLNPDYGKAVDPNLDQELAQALDNDFLQVGNLHEENLQVENQREVLSTLSSNESSKRDSDFKEIANALATLTGGGLNSTSADLISTWLEKHTVAWVLKAITLALTNKARSAKYVDSILVGWEANGYPKTREQKVAAKKNDHQQPTLTGEALAQARREAQSLLEAQ